MKRITVGELQDWLEDLPAHTEIADITREDLRTDTAGGFHAILIPEGITNVPDVRRKCDAVEKAVHDLKKVVSQ